MPSEIKIGFHNVPIDQFIPKPMQWNKCFIFGHIQKFCTSKDQICATCSEKSHTPEECAKVKCINCKPGEDQHQSTNKQCPQYLKKQEILKYQTINKTFYNEAKLYINQHYSISDFNKNITNETLSTTNQKQNSIEENTKINNESTPTFSQILQTNKNQTHENFFSKIPAIMETSEENESN